MKNNKISKFLKKQSTKLTPIHEVSLARNLAGTFTCILAFSLLIYILLIHPLDGDKASSLAGMFSFAATLFAPVAAFFLINNWKEETKYNALMNYIADIINEKSILTEQLNEIRTDKDVFMYLENLIIHKNNLKLSEIRKELKIPKFNKVFSTLERIRIINLKIMMYDPQLESHIFKTDMNNFDSFYRLETCIKGLEACFFKILVFPQLPIKDGEIVDNNILLQQCLYINSTFSNQYRSLIDPSIQDEYTEKLNKAITDSFEDIKKFRKSLN